MPYDALGNAPNRTRVLFVSSEIFPLAKSGGLADVSGALPRFIAESGDIDVVLMLPGYPSALERLEEKTHLGRVANIPGGDAMLIQGVLPGTDMRVIALDQPSLFDRPGLYTDESGSDWPDNPVRFAALCHAAVRVAMGGVLPHWRADIIHCNDWHTGLIPVLVAAQDGPKPRTVMTIHNLAFQGNFGTDMLPALHLQDQDYSALGLEFYGNVSFLKGGVVNADTITTVSPSYAEEIVGEEFGMGFEGLLSSRKSDLVGILNGIDTEVWDPERDALLPARYSRGDLEGKAVCKAAVQQDWGLGIDRDASLIVFLARLELQKMADVLLDILPALMERPGVQVAILGTGSPEIEEALAAWPARAPGRVAVRIGYDEDVAHRLLAGGDMLLHGSRFEPCGLTPLYALRYGTVPIVNEVGGLRDTSIGANPDSLESGKANAVHFTDPSSAGMLGAVDDALALQADQAVWAQLRDTAMAADFSWRKPAGQYRRLYETLALADQTALV